MILFFILIAIIPIAALSTVFTYTVIKFREEMVVVYQGFASNLEILSRNKADLAAIRSDLIQFSFVPGEQERSARISHILELKTRVDGSMDNYKHIEDLPTSFDQALHNFNISRLASDEVLLVTEINQQWNNYSSRLEDLSILASDPSFSDRARADANQLILPIDRLISSYDSLHSVNGQIGGALMEQSQRTMQLAFLYGGLASAISAASATAAAILVSKRVVLGDLVRMTKLDLVETTLRDLIGDGADALLAMVKSQMAGEKPQQIETESATAIMPPQEDIVIGAIKQPAKRQATAKVSDYKPIDMDQELKGKLVLINYNNSSQTGQQATWMLDQLFGTPDLIILTRRGSNFYHEAQGKYTVYILKDRTQNSKKSGERVVLAGDEVQLAHAIENIMNENPRSTVLVDNATDLIYTLGFEKVFSLLGKLADVASNYEDSCMVVLINKKAHEPWVIEALTSVSNKFIDQLSSSAIR